MQSNRFRRLVWELENGGEMALTIMKPGEKYIISGFEQDFCFDNASEFISEIKGAYFMDPADVLLIFRDVSYIDSSGVGQIIQLSKSLRNNGHRLMLANVTETVMRVLKMFNLEEALSFSSENPFMIK